MKKLLVLFLILITINLFGIRILLSDSETIGHAYNNKVNLLKFCPTAEVVIRTDGFESDVEWAIDNDIDIISRSISGMSDAIQEGSAQLAHDNSIGVVYAHGSNSHVLLDRTTYIGNVVVVGFGNSRYNSGSYGDGLEMWVIGATSQSTATAQMAGMIAEIMIRHNTTFQEARMIIRSTATWYPEFRTCTNQLICNLFTGNGGYGGISWETIELKLAELYSVITEPEYIIKVYKIDGEIEIIIEEIK